MENIRITKNLRKSFECPVCMSNFDNGRNIPKVLPCGNNICSLCLKTLIHVNQGCPLCKEPLVGSYNLYPTNLVLRDIVTATINTEDDEEISKRTNTSSAAGTSSTNSSSSSHWHAGKCKKHASMEMQLHCSTHKKWICGYCLKEDHIDCLTRTVQETIQDFKDEAKHFWDNTLVKLNEKTNSYELKISRLNQDMRNIRRSINELKRKRDTNCTKLDQAKRQRAQSLLMWNSCDVDIFNSTRITRNVLYAVSEVENDTSEVSEYTSEEDSDVVEDDSDNDSVTEEDTVTPPGTLGRRHISGIS